MRDWLGELPPVRQLLLATAAACVLGAITLGVPLLVNVGLLLACALLVAALALVVARLWQGQQRTDWTEPGLDAARQRGSDSRVTSLAHDVALTAGGNADASRRLHALFTALADDRLRSRHSVSRADQPEEAASRLGPELTAYLSGPGTARITAAQAAAFTTTLEEI